MPSIADYEASEAARNLEAHKQAVREQCMTLEMNSLYALAQHYFRHSTTSLLLLEDKVRQRQVWNPNLKIVETPEQKRYLRNILVEDHVTAFNNIELLRLVVEHMRAQNTLPDNYVVDLGIKINELVQRGKRAQDAIKYFVADPHDLHIA